MAGANEGKNKLKGIHKSPLSSPFPSPIGTCNAGWSEISACKKVVVFFSDFFQERIQARSKRGLLPVARFGPPRLLRVLVARKTRKNGVFSEGNLIFGQTLPTCSIERTLRSSLSRKITEEGRRVFVVVVVVFFSHGVQYLNGNKQTKSTVPVQCSILSRGISF